MNRTKQSLAAASTLILRGWCADVWVMKAGGIPHYCLEGALIMGAAVANCSQEEFGEAWNLVYNKVGNIAAYNDSEERTKIEVLNLIKEILEEYQDA